MKIYSIVKKILNKKKKRKFPDNLENKKILYLKFYLNLLLSKFCKYNLAQIGESHVKPIP